ncbi:MAG: hypothetical protein ACM336_01560 [Acidobacteriota bacterium]
MALPETIRVKISSEAAESISLTPVVVREMPARELIEAMLGVAGKDAPRLHELLLRGSLVAGASRLRWDGLDADRAALDALLATFPDPDPSRAFARAWCVRAALKGRGARIEIAREAASERRLFRRASFWDGLMDAAEAASPRYAGYSYKDRADHYTAGLAPADAARIRDAAAMLRYSGLAAQIRNAALDSAEFWVERR